MNTRFFSVYDSKAEAFIQPFFSPTHATAIRMFSMAANDPAHNFKIHAADYTLFAIGEFDQHTAKVDVYPTPINLGLAITFSDHPDSDYTDDELPLPQSTKITQLPIQKESK